MAKEGLGHGDLGGYRPSITKSQPVAGRAILPGVSRGACGELSASLAFARKSAAPEARFRVLGARGRTVAWFGRWRRRRASRPGRPARRPTAADIGLGAFVVELFRGASFQ